MPYATANAAQMSANRTGWSVKKFICLLLSQSSCCAACLGPLGSHKRRRGRLLDWLGRRRSRAGVALGGGVGERQAQVGEQLLEVALHRLVDLPLERPE